MAYDFSQNCPRNATLHFHPVATQFESSMLSFAARGRARRRCRLVKGKNRQAKAALPRLSASLTALISPGHESGLPRLAILSPARAAKGTPPCHRESLLTPTGKPSLPVAPAQEARALKFAGYNRARCERWLQAALPSTVTRSATLPSLNDVFVTYYHVPSYFKRSPSNAIFAQLFQPAHFEEVYACVIKTP